MRKIILALIIFNLTTVSFVAKAHDPEAEEQEIIESVEEVDKKKFDKLPEFYVLADRSIMPKEDEFYVKSLYRARSNRRAKIGIRSNVGKRLKKGNKGAAKALIARSNNLRSGNLFNFPIEYSVGDKLTARLTITDIKLNGKRHVIVKDNKTDEKYLLRVSYGKAISRLVPIRN